MNRPWFLSTLSSDWFPAVPEIQTRLEAGAAITDVGCREGWSSIGFALGYPNVTVDGYDVDQPSIAAAKAHADQAGLSDRVQFQPLSPLSTEWLPTGVREHGHSTDYPSFLTGR